MKRPIPADFCTLAPTMYLKDLKAHYKTGYSTLGKWLDRTGLKTRPMPMRPAPDDFAQVAPTMLIEQIKAHYHCHAVTLKRWFAETGVQPAKGFRRTPPPPRQSKDTPDDFAQIAPTMLARDLCIHYQTGRHTLRRWLRESGVSTLKYVQPKKAAPKPKRIDRKTGLHGSNIHSIRRVTDIYQDAVATLQRAGWRVCRCNERGGADDKGTHYRVGILTLTPDEMLAKAAEAERKAA